MTSSIDADLLADLGSRPTNALALFEFDLAGSTKKYAQTWGTSSTGLIEGYVIDAGQITRSVSDVNFQLPRDSAQVRISDAARVIEKIVTGTAAGAVSGAPARVKIASSTRAQAKWFTAFTGVIGSFSAPGSLAWEFSIVRDDKALNGLAKIPLFQRADWPNAPTDTVGKPARVVYGKHSSARTAATGMVPTTRVDDGEFRYVVSFGPIASIDTVYVDKAQVPAADYTVDLSFFNRGQYWSIVDFVADPGADAVITVDCEGITSGGLITNTATQLEHFLTNFGFGDWGMSTTQQSSAWLSASNFNIDETYFTEAEDFLSDKQVASGGRVISGDRKSIDVLNEWTKQWKIPSFWTYGGKIAIRPDDHTLTSTYISSPWLRQEMSPAPDALNVEFDASRLIDEVRVDYNFNAVSGSFQNALTVKDGSKGHATSELLPFHWRESKL